MNTPDAARRGRPRLDQRERATPGPGLAGPPPPRSPHGHHRHRPRSTLRRAPRRADQPAPGAWRHLDGPADMSELITTRIRDHATRLTLPHLGRESRKSGRPGRGRHHGLPRVRRPAPGRGGRSPRGPPVPHRAQAVRPARTTRASTASTSPSNPTSTPARSATSPPWSSSPATPTSLCSAHPGSAKPTSRSRSPSPPAPPDTRSTSPASTKPSSNSAPPKPPAGSPRSSRPTYDPPSSSWTKSATSHWTGRQRTWSSSSSAAATNAAQ